MKENVEQARSVIAFAAATTPAKVPVDTTEVVEAVQLVLRSLGYVEAGPPLGEGGPKTEAAILDFRNRNNLPDGTSIDGDLLNALLVAGPKVLPFEQVTATAAEIAPKVEIVNKNLWTKFWAKITAIPAFIGALFMGSLQYLGDAVAILTQFKSFVNDWLDGIDKLTLVAYSALATAVVSGALWFNSRQADAAATGAYRDGTLKDDNKELPS